jgi:hypothetical protein
VRTCTSDVTIKSSIEAHLGVRDLKYISPYFVALGEARHLAGRNIKTGIYNPDHAYIGFVGLLSYLCIIDHLGAIFSPKLPIQSSPSTNPFKRMLHEFTALSADIISALYGLRCSLAHNISLTNSDPRNLYCFSLVRSVTHPLFTPAAKPWDGVYRDSTGNPYQYNTTINMVKVGDIVEEIHKQLLDLHGKKQLDCILDQPQFEMISKYALIISSGP